MKLEMPISTARSILLKNIIFELLKEAQKTFVIGVVK